MFCTLIVIDGGITIPHLLENLLHHENFTYHTIKQASSSKKVFGPNLGPNRYTTKEVKSCSCYCCVINHKRREEYLYPKTGAIHYHAQLGLPDKSRAIKWLTRDISDWSGLAQRCYQPC